MTNPKLIVAFAAAFITLSTPSWAWKPTTHVFLAEMALRDALDDGKLSFFRVNHIAGQVLTQKVGDFDVDPTLLTALRKYPFFYRTGVLGPDAQPDILTGQRVIHPNYSPGGAGLVPRGANAWLKHLWRQAASVPGEKGLKARAYAAGYLTHAAGDMFAHTFVNHFTGKEFEVGRNGAEHIFLEGYLAKRTPTLTPEMFDARMDADLADFIYETLVKASPNSVLQRNLLVDGFETSTSIPWMFSKLRNTLQDRVTALRAESGINQVINAPQVAYLDRWIADIDRGLKAWPFTSHEIARAMFFMPGGINIQKAEQEAEKYKNAHLLSMMGLPDFVGLASALISQIKDAIIPPALKAGLVKFAREKLLDVLLMGAFNMTSAQMLDELKDPRILWPQFMLANRPGVGERIQLAAMNQTHIKLSDTGFSNPAERFDFNRFTPAYNTVVMSKLVLLDNNSATRLMTELAKPPPSSGPKLFTGSEKFQPIKEHLLMNSIKATKFFSREIGGFNLMLNFDRSMDDSRQWKAHPEKMLLFSMGVFEHIFMKQAGDR